ncbi:MAG: YqaA family protein [Prevotellamassilia sp.]|nr:YqaA family protein [Prevotellamassilia sp.]
MDALFTILIQHGGIGMFAAAFLAGSFFPFASEVVMVGLLAAGTDPTELLLWGTAGNVLGALFNYGVGSLGKEEWIERWTKVKPEKLERGKQWIHRYGAWAGLLAWVPIIGSVITVSMGFLRTKLIYSMITVAIGKFIRYWLLIQAYCVV